MRVLVTNAEDLGLYPTRSLGKRGEYVISSSHKKSVISFKSTMGLLAPNHGIVRKSFRILNVHGGIGCSQVPLRNEENYGDLDLIGRLPEQSP